MGCIAAIPLLVVLVVGLGTAYTNTQSLLIDKATLMVREIVDRTRAYLAPAEAVPIFLGDLVDRGSIDPDDRQQVREAIRYAFAGAPQLGSVAYVHADGWSMVASRDPEHGRVGVEEGAWRDDPTIRAAVKASVGQGSTPHWSEPLFIAETGTTVVSFVRPIIRDGHFHAAIAATISIRALSRFISRVGSDLQENCFILYGRNQVIAFRTMIDGPLPISRAQPLPRLSDVEDPVLSQIWAPGNEWHTFSEHDAALSGGSIVSRKVGGRPFIFLDAPLNRRGSPEHWIVGSYVAAQEVDAEARRVRLAAVIGVAALLLATIAAFVLSRGLVRPVEALARASEAVSRLEVDMLAALPGSRLIELDGAVSAFNRMVVALRLFARYVPRRLVQMLLERGEAEILRSREREVTILFTDIVGFTRMAERMSAEACAQFLNAHLGLLTACVEDGGGLVDKFIGDCVMAFWVDPPGTSTQDQPGRAVRTALRMREAIRADNLAHGRKVRVRIGIHTGPAIVGNIGAPTRVNFTVVGDSVNVAQRLEQLNKALQPDQQVAILMSEPTARRLPDDLRARSLGPHRLRGRQQPMELFTIDSRSC
jgi:class 3 adenylate cyclase